MTLSEQALNGDGFTEADRWFVDLVGELIKNIAVALDERGVPDDIIAPAIAEGIAPVMRREGFVIEFMPPGPGRAQ